MLNKKIEAWVAIISHQRSSNVTKMSQKIGNATWYVGEGEGERYRWAGAEFVSESGGLCRSRNAALEDAFDRNLPCIQLSDDLSRIKFANNDKKAVPISFNDAAKKVLQEMKDRGAFYGGAAPTDNAYFFHPEKPVSENLFIVGDFTVVLPSPPRFDESLRLKEDYDFTLQHLTEYGKVARCNFILASFAHRKNAGGAVHYRTSELEQKTIQQLKTKWPGCIKDNAKRPDEVLMRWKRQ